MKKITKIVIILVIYIGLIFINTQTYGTTATTTNETTRLRKEASTSSDTLALISRDNKVEIIDTEGDWYKVKYVDAGTTYTGYIRKDMLVTEESVNNEINTENTTSSESNTTNQENEVTDQTPENIEETNTENISSEVNNSDNETEETLKIGYKGKTSDSLQLKILPSINSNNVSTINENTEFTIVDIINKWCYIENEQESGWILLSKIKSKVKEQNEITQVEENQSHETEKEKTSTDQENKQETIYKKYVSTETLNVREEAENNAKIILQLTINTEVTVVDIIDNTWAKITVKGKTGYVASKYLSDTKVDVSSRSESETRTSKESTGKEETSSAQKEVSDSSNSSAGTTTGSRGTDIVSFAKQYLGYKYVSGGTSPSTGFDCSGFAYYVFKNFGVTLSRTSTAQASNGTAVSKADLKAGDLLIFNNSANTKIGHVGIYIGGNTFIHAANSSKGVITTSLSDSYYSPRFVSARRIIN